MKVESYPKATVFWYLNGKEILPSKEFGIDNLEDGTSILTLSEVYPDDAGELMCEAHNDKGVVTSIVQLNITGKLLQFLIFNSINSCTKENYTYINIFFNFKNNFYIYSGEWNQLYCIYYLLS